MIFGNIFEKRDFVKICILLKKNHYFQAFEFLTTDRKSDTNLIKNLCTFGMAKYRLKNHEKLDLGGSWVPFGTLWEWFCLERIRRLLEPLGSSFGVIF